MLFCSREFLLFFLTIFIVYWLLPLHKLRVGLLLVSSFAFYASWNQWLACLICVTTTADYLIARLLDSTTTTRRRKMLLLLSLAVNLGLLIYFKYANFFLESLQEALRAAGLSASMPVLSVILPVGISFYTFEAISYTVDVYQHRIRAEPNLGHFMLFILFFPHLIAGPIVRARDFLPQVRRRKRWSWGRFNLGAQFFLMGAFKKVVLADRMALLVDPVFDDPSQYGTRTLWMATLAWALQVYCDFSGYTDMALGCAHLLGYKLSQNFNMPYLAPNIAEFWRRWHISLSSWLRDYLFIPLGGSRGTRWQTGRNLLVTMMLGGLWHGAHWPYVVFGVLQGILLMVHRAFREFCAGRPRLDQALQTATGTSLRVAFTFLCFCATLVIFRCPTVAAGAAMLRAMLLPVPDTARPFSPVQLWFALAVVVLCHALVKCGLWQRMAIRLPVAVLGLGQALAVSLVLLLAVGGGRAFVYFQF
jgi:alginate O-acetyltransferase complex protein AlgI